MTGSSLNLRPGASFPASQLFSGWGEPSRIEADVYELESYGQVGVAVGGGIGHVDPAPSRVTSVPALGSTSRTRDRSIPSPRETTLWLITARVS